jgi:hypothetical protein
VIKEQSDVPQGWDKLKVGQSIKLKNDRDGSITSWTVASTSPNPGPGGGSRLFLNPSDDAARNLSPDRLEVSFLPNEMKISLPGGMNTIVKDEVVKKLPAKPEMITPDPNKPRQIKKDLDKKGFYTLYTPGKMWELGDEAYTGYHIKKQGMGVSETIRGLNERYCNVFGKTPDGLNIFLKLICRPSGGQKLVLIKVGNKSFNMIDVQNDNLVDDINCGCPQG